MNLFINDRPCEASTGQKIGKAARLNHSHVGYVCGGHGICQACYVTVQEGKDCLSPLTDIERAFLSDRQISAGGRLACQAAIEKDGTVRVLSRPEEVRRLLFTNPPALFAYGAEMGRDTASRILPGVSNLAGRIAKGEMDGRNAPGDLLESAGAAVQLALTSLSQMMPFREQLTGVLGSIPALPSMLSSLPSLLTSIPSMLPQFPSLPLPISLPFFGQQAAPEKLERVVLTISPRAVQPVSVNVKESSPATDVASLEGIDESHALKLIKAGVKSFDNLLERGRDRNGRKELSGASGITEEHILTLVNRADLARIKGVGFSWSELLEASGVDTVPELAQRNPSNLYAKMLEVNNLKTLVHQLPSADQVKAWIEQAKNLPRMINY